MDSSLTNLMNESQCNEDKYLLELNITESTRINIKLVLYIIGIIFNFIILFINSLFTNILLYLISLLATFTGTYFIYKNNEYIKQNIILSSVYVMSIFFEIVLLTINDNSIINTISLVVTMCYQIIYITNFE